MNKLLDRINHFFEQVPDRVRKFRWQVWITFLLLTAIISVGMAWLKIDMSMEVYFQKDEPVKQAYDRFRAIFGGDEVVFIVYEAKDGDIFSDQSLKALQGVQNDLLNYRLQLKPGEASPLDHITDVKTLINVNYLETREETLLSRHFIGTHFPQTEEEREQLRQLALEHPDYPFVYLSKNSQYGGIVIRTDFNAIAMESTEAVEQASGQGSEQESTGSLDEEEEETMASLDEEEELFEVDQGIMESPLPSEDDYPVFQKHEIEHYVPFTDALEEVLNKPAYTRALTFHPVGMPVLMGFFGKIIEEELSNITGGCLLLIIVMLWLLFRSFSGVLWPFLIIIFSIVWVVGLIGWSGVAMTTMITVIVFLVLAVGVADAVHILSGYLFFRNQNQDHQTALRSVFRKSGLACFLTSMTTSIGLIALIFVPIVPIQNFGVFSALGVFFAFLFTIFLLPLMLDLWSPFSKKRAQRISALEEQHHLILKFLHRVENLGYRHAKLFVSIFLVSGIILLFGTFKVRINSDMIENIKEGISIRTTYDLVNRFMGGTDNMEFLVDLGKTEAMKDPRVLNAIDELQNYIETTHENIVVKTSSLVNVAKDSFKTLNEGRQEMYVIPQDPHVLEQTLFLFNNANPKDRRQLVSDDYRMGRISVSIKNIGSQAAVALAEDV